MHWILNETKRELAQQFAGCAVAMNNMWLNANELSLSLRGAASETAEECVIKANFSICKSVL
jgi:hypothetical protein